MSAGYAERLSVYPNKGVVGLPESFDSVRSLSNKINALVKVVHGARHVVVLTGAGISTSSGIADFRGPNGIWTREDETRTGKTNRWSAASSRSTLTANRNSKKRKIASSNDESASSSTTLPTAPSLTISCLSEAQPTLTHRAITQLVQDDKIKYVITQNVDGLHRRSGLSRRYHSCVHGCVFTSKCYECGTEYFGDEDTGGLSFQQISGKRCQQDDCDGTLHDMLLDWNDPVLDIDRVECECKKADVVLCLGTSLRIDPVGSLPLLAQKFVIVNLQATPHDESAALIIRGLVDDVMHRLLLGLGYSDDWEDTAANSATIERVWKPTDVESVKAFQEVVHDADERRESMKRTSSKRRKKEREPNT